MPAAVVTGAGSGLGRAIAIELAGRGFVVLATDVDAGAAAETADSIGVGTTSMELDVRDQDACRAAAAAAISRSGSLDLWVNNAGVLFTGNSWEQDEAARRTMLDVNTVGTMNGTVAALEQMTVAGAGHVINVVSLAAWSRRRARSPTRRASTRRWPSPSAPSSTCGAPGTAESS